MQIFYCFFQFDCFYYCDQGLIHELVDYNLRRGSPVLRSEVRHLLCLMSNNNVSATDELIELLTRRVSVAVDGHLSNPDLVSIIWTLCKVQSLFKHLWYSPQSKVFDLVRIRKIHQKKTFDTLIDYLRSVSSYHPSEDISNHLWLFVLQQSSASSFAT